MAARMLPEQWDLLVQSNADLSQAIAGALTRLFILDRNSGALAQAQELYNALDSAAERIRGIAR
ncbi:MAG TPA: hypothetical protein VMU40_02455 [Steroidobacteraceae bacterium]|nr:hypothetical protein [Steroidobacteraceae bacterium]